MAGQRIGYIRVSSLDQNTQRQLEGIQLDRIFTDNASGKDTKRPQLEELLRFIRDGDTLVVHSMDRLARNLDDLRSLVQKLTKIGARIEFLKEHLIHDQDLTARKNALVALGVTSEKTFTDHGLTGANRARPGLREAVAACRARDTLVVTKLDRLARSLRDAKAIVDELTRREVKLSIGGSVHDPVDPLGRLLFNVLAMVAEFEADLIRARTREGMGVAKAKGRLRGKQPKPGRAGSGSRLRFRSAGGAGWP